MIENYLAALFTRKDYIFSIEKKQKSNQYLFELCFQKINLSNW